MREWTFAGKGQCVCAKGADLSWRPRTHRPAAWHREMEAVVSMGSLFRRPAARRLDFSDVTFCTTSPTEGAWAVQIPGPRLQADEL